MKSRGTGVSRSTIAERLRSRHGEIEAAVLARVNAIADPFEATDPAYPAALRAAVDAAIEYALDGLERPDSPLLPVPVSLLTQARLAARSGVGLEIVLRRYVAGYSLISGFLIQEARGEKGTSGASVEEMLSTQTMLLDRLITAVGEEFAREEAHRYSTAERRRAARIEGLLEGERLDTEGIPYDFSAWHVGAVALGPGVAQALARLAEPLGARLLQVAGPSRATAWIWLGTRRPLDLGELLEPLHRTCTEGAVALGEPHEGLAGWRLTHRQALITVGVATRQGSGAVRYADAALLASALRDELLRTSLFRLWVKPLETEQDGGRALKATLRAYLASGWNVSSTAAALGVSRRTVTVRLRTAERKIGRTLEDAPAELDLALRLDELEGAGTPRMGSPLRNLGSYATGAE